jgi:hypothetical protein
MKLFILILVALVSYSCTTAKPEFQKEKVCSEEALRYLRNPRNSDKRSVQDPKLYSAMSDTSRSMQLCYEDFKERTGVEEFNTCLVVGVDYFGQVEFYNLGSQEVHLDQTFKNCAKGVTDSVPFQNYGSNYVLIQSYQFYVEADF